MSSLASFFMDFFENPKASRRRWERRSEAEAKIVEHAERIESLRSEIPAVTQSTAESDPKTLEIGLPDEVRREAIIERVQKPSQQHDSFG